MSVLGVVDWGIGGIDVVAKLRSAGVLRPVLYVSDSGATPYGRQSDTGLTARLQTLLEALAGHGCDEVVVGCNAASTVIPGLQDLPLRRVLGVIQPGIHATVAAGVPSVAVLGGRRTIESGQYGTALRACGIAVTEVVAQPLSALVERGITAGPEVDATVAEIARPIRDATAIVSACTHYLAALPALRNALPRLTTVIDPAQALVQRHFCPAPRGTTCDRYWTTGDPAASQRAAMAAFGFNAPFVAARAQLPAPC